MCQIGSKSFFCICESCFQSLSLRQGQTIQLILSNKNAQVFLCKEIYKGNINISYVIKLSSLIGDDKTLHLLSCSFRSFCDSVDKSLYLTVLSGKQFLSEQIYDSMMQNTISNSPNQQRVTIRFMVLHRNSVSYSFYTYHNNSIHRFYVMNQEYDAKCLEGPIKVYRCEIDQSSIVLYYPSILQNDNKLLPGATYCVENALREGANIVIDSQSTIRCVRAPVIPPSISCLSVSEALRYTEGKPIWMIGKLIDYSFVRTKEKCLILVQDCWSGEVIEFWSGDFIQLFSIGQLLVFADINVNNRMNVYTENSSVFQCPQPYPVFHSEILSPLALSCDNFSWQVVDVISISSIKVQLVCSCCQQIYSCDCSCHAERSNCQLLCLVQFVCVLNGKVVKGLLRGDAGFRWLNLSNEIGNDILKHIEVHNMWNSDMSSVYDHSYTRRLLGRVKVLARKSIFFEFLNAIDVKPVDLQVVLEDKLRKMQLNERTREAFSENCGLDIIQHVVAE